MNRSMKRYCSIVLCLVLVLSLLPLGAWATPTDAEQVLNDAYSLQEGESLSYEVTLTGVITEIITAYDSYYQNITVEMVVPGYEHLPVRCYRLSGVGAEYLAVGDSVTVTGILANYYGTIEFQQGCILQTDVYPDPTVPTTVPPTVSPIVPVDVLEEAYALGPGESLPYEAELTGQIVSVDDPYHEMYENITVTMVVDGRDNMPIVCYRMRGDGVECLQVGDIITVAGQITRYVKTDPDTGDVITDQVEFAMPQLVSFGGGEMTRVYCNPPMDWQMCYVYWWGSGTECPMWPGIAMSMDPLGIWSGSVPSDAEGLVFNNFYYINTQELQVPTDDLNQYNVEQQCWSVYGKDFDDWGPDSLALVGDNLPGINIWDPADPAGDMQKVSPGIYVKELVFSEACEVEFKIAGNDVWDAQWVLGGGEIQLQEWAELERGYNGQNMWLSVPGPCTLRFTVDINGLRSGDTAYMCVDTDTEPVQTRRLIVFAPDTWQNVNAYTWDPEAFGSWPGAALECCDYYYEMKIPVTLTNLVPNGTIWDGTMVHTNDLQIEPGVGDVIINIYGEQDNYWAEIVYGPNNRNRKLTVIAPDFWSWVYAYTWEPETFGSYPGEALEAVGGVYELMIPCDLTDLVLSGERQSDSTRYQTGEITLKSGSDDVTVTILDDGSYVIRYGDTDTATYRVVGNADWMGNWREDSDEGIMTKAEPGVYYKNFPNVAPGSYEFKITKDGKWDWAIGNPDGSNFSFTVERTCEVWVTLYIEGGDASVQVEFQYDYLPGDTTGDGNVNLGDVSLLYAHVRGTRVMDEQALFCADFNQDGNVNMGDISSLYAYIRGTDPRGTVDAAYRLEFNEEMPQDSTLTGTVIDVIEPYKNGAVTVLIAVEDREDMPIICSRMTGEDVQNVGINDEIKVTGRLRNFYGTVEFKEGCRLVKWTHAITDEEKMGAIVDAAYALVENETMDHEEILTGTVISMEQSYAPGLPYISVTMAVAGRENMPIFCYRMVGNEIDLVDVGDIITVRGTLRNYGGTVEFAAGCLLECREPGISGPVVPDDQLAIVDEAYALAIDTALPYVATLTGKVVYIQESYSPQYKNISVVMQVPGRESYPLICYRMKGTDADKVAVDDTITVTGTIKNYNGSIQFETGCTMDKRVSGGGKPATQETDPMKIIDMAYALSVGAEMAYAVTLTGRVTEYKEAYNEQYKSISVMFVVVGRESKPIQLYGLKGDGVQQVAVNDTITVVGRLKNYNGTVEMVNCSMTNRVSGGGKPPVQETTPASIMAAAKQLAENAELPYEVTLTGKVTSFDEAYDSEYQNVSVVISVDGTSDSLLLFRLKGTGVDQVAVGDTITVTGKIKNHYGTIELTYGEMTKRVSGGGQPPVAQTDYTKIVDEAYALAPGAELAYTVALEGRITELQSPYDPQFWNMTVVMTVEGRENKPIVCYRMKGDDIGNHLCVGDTITVEGKIKNYVDTKGNSTIEFDTGCKMTARKAGSVTKPSDPKQIVDAAFQLGENEVLPYFATLTGTVKSIDEPYSEMYRNIVVTMTVQGTNGAYDIVCYRLKGDGVEYIAVGDTITVTGAIKRYVREMDGVREDFVEFDAGCMLEA